MTCASDTLARKRPDILGDSINSHLLRILSMLIFSLLYHYHEQLPFHLSSWSSPLWLLLLIPRLLLCPPSALVKPARSPKPKHQIARPAPVSSPTRPLRMVSVRPLRLVMHASTCRWMTPHKPSARNSTPCRSCQGVVEQTPPASARLTPRIRSPVSGRSSSTATGCTAPTGRVDTVVVGMRTQCLSMCLRHWRIESTSVICYRALR